MVGMTSAPPDASAAKARTPRLVLASASPARKKLLEDSGIVFEGRVSNVDEDASPILMRMRFLPAPQKPMGTSTLRRRLRSCWPKQKRGLLRTS